MAKSATWYFDVIDDEQGTDARLSFGDSDFCCCFFCL